MKALVNGKPMELTVKKQYYNGTETVYECVNQDGIWISVAASMVIVNVRTRIEYCGNRASQGLNTRNAYVAITAKSAVEAEVAHERLVSLAHQYEAAGCSNVEEESNGTFTIFEYFLVEDRKDFEYFKKHIYRGITKNI